MKNQSKTKQVLIQELVSLRQRIAELEQSESERKRVNDLLQLHSEILAHMVESVHLIRVDDGVIVYTNPRFDSVFGYDPGELVGKHVSIINAPGGKTPEDVANEIIKNLKQAGVWKGEVHNIRKDGTSFWSYANVSTFKHPQYGEVWISVHRDITERKQAEEALKEMEAQYRNLFENANEAIFVAQDGWFVFLNPMSTMMIGYSGKELMAKPFTEFIHPDDREMVINRHSRRMKGEEIPFPYSFQIIHKDGNSKWVEVNAVLINWKGKPATLNFLSDITDRKRAEEVLRKRDIQFKKLSSWVPGMIYQFTKRPDGTYCMPFTTEAIKDILGCSPQDVREDFSPIARVILPEDFDKVIGSIEYSAKHLTIWTCEYRVQIPGQSIRWMLGHSTPEKLADGGITWYGFITDITESKQAEEALQRSETKFRTLYDSTSDAVILLDKKGFISCNKPTLKMFGYATLEEFCSKHLADLSPNEQPDGADSMVLAQQMIVTAMEKGSLHFEWMHKRNDTGETFPADVLFTAMELDGNPVLQAVIRDITERKQAEEKIQQMAYHDILTGLPNRKLFSDRLGIALAQAQRNKNKVGVAMLDLDKFKDVNDTLGHDVGDLLLKAAANRLSAALRKGDTVARFGGDEFVLSFPDLKEREDVIQVAQKIVESFRKPFLIGTHQLTVTTSIGIAVYPNDGADEGILLKNADIALYQAKLAGRSRYQLFKKGPPR